MNLAKLRGARAEKGLSQGDVAKHLGISVVSYGKKERGKVPITIQEAVEIAMLLGKAPEKIFFTK